MKNEKDYFRIRAEIDIDMMRIDEHLIRLPALVQEASERCAYALRDRDEADHDMKISFAMAAAKLRSLNEKISEARVGSEAALDEDYTKARQHFEDRKLDAALWATLVDALKTKMSSLNRVSDLVVAGYLTLNTTYKDERAKLADKRNSVPRFRPAETAGAVTNGG